MGWRGMLVIETKADTAQTKVATNVADVTWLPTSRTKLRIMRGPNCCDAKVRARMVMENTTPTTVITAAAMAISTWRAVSRSRTRSRRQMEMMVVRRPIDLEGHQEKKTGDDH